MSLFVKYFIFIDAIALDYRVNLLVLYPLHKKAQNAISRGSINRTLTAIREIAPRRIA
jgi:hypothetical protein